MVHPLELELTALGGEPRPVSEWLTTFPLLPVVLDPYTHESAWILDTARRVLLHYRGAGCRPCFVIAAEADDARRFLGPYADEILTFADPAAAASEALGLTRLPGFLLVKQDGSVAARAEGWDPDGWREVAEAASALSHWSRPTIPEPGDPVPYAGTPTGV